MFEDGALSKGSECKYNVNPFCMYVKDAYTNNKELLRLLKSCSNGTTFNDDKENVETNIQNILVVLRTEKKSELLTPLKMALDAEAHALFHLSVSCHGDKGEMAVCKKGLKDLCQATFDVVFAIGQVVEGGQKDRVLKAYGNVKARKYNESEVCPKLYRDAAIEVSNAIQN
ncbi:unnamed protein product [Nippostrongylus brasiliensis]|uniref:CASPASE_P20 domain-containing protein n=1 Tax=Nippostrongylus brasiliensis TaxID=27835 RepID=A0A0N4XG31_NIPBR|nr:unnamed protein product [Nippostrongylus brasiliensis]